jgi:SOS-response transcriptional repressor LexA
VPVETALPNLKLLDLPFPIREKLTKKEENYAESLFKAKSKQGSIERSKYKARSINFNEDLNIDMTNIDQSKMKMLNNKRKPSIKSCQVSE